ncbi:MAG: 2-dehydropantoate 2-reductase [Clostridiales bacterium]
MKNIKILIVGTGAIGSYYGGRLSQAGAEVSALCRSDYNIVKEKGITIESIYGNFIFKPHEVINKISDYSEIPDFIIVSTKVLPQINIVDIINEKVGENTSIVLIQNGIDIEKNIAKSFPNNELISGLAFICVSRTEPGKVIHQDYGKLSIGTYPQGISKKTKLLQELFEKANVKCLADENIVNSRWQKLVWNAPFNPISVIGGKLNTAEILRENTSFNLVKNVMKEIVLLASNCNITLPSDIINQNLENTLKMTPYKTSMLLDYENKRPLEVEAILGNALKIAGDLNLRVPYIESLHALLLLLDKKNTENH